LSAVAEGVKGYNDEPWKRIQFLTRNPCHKLF
jgi:hypothetical protein